MLLWRSTSFKLFALVESAPFAYEEFLTQEFLLTLTELNEFMNGCRYATHSNGSDSVWSAQPRTDASRLVGDSSALQQCEVTNPHSIQVWRDLHVSYKCILTLIRHIMTKSRNPPPSIVFVSSIIKNEYTFLLGNFLLLINSANINSFM
ncbi:unnamed protein product [Protopolystoma xenopodis]|uniref:Uncharacterized protein n=1 Tax=Protopolystoma xenopodis TaxID=117903 RepID=A0A448WRM1_9PLAT|nr:unnamed protein product [Protopolystoma xenopodis]